MAEPEIGDEFIFIYKKAVVENKKIQTYILESEPFALEDWLDVLDAIEDEQAEEIVVLCMVDTETRRVMTFKEIPNRVEEIKEK